MKIREFSKKLLCLDYMVAFLLILIQVFFTIKNAEYMATAQALLMESGSCATLIYPYDTSVITQILSFWIAQLGVSTTAYYIMCKSDHKIQLPIRLIRTLPADIKEQVNMDQLITTVLTSTNN